MRTQFVMSELAIGLRRNVTMTVAAIITITISVTLLGLALMIRSGASRLQHDVINQIEVSVYFESPCGSPSATANCLTPADQTAVHKTLQGLPQVEHITYISQEDACKRFRDQNPDNPELVRLTPCSALPASFAVKLKDPRQFPIIESAVSQAPGVDSVTDAHHEFDSLFHFFHVVALVVLVVMLVILVAAILLIYNAMLVAAFSRRRETGIMRLVGASDFYIQAPFILEGTVIGLAGTGFSVLLVGVLRAIVKTATDQSPIFKPFGDLTNFTHALLPMILLGILLPAIASFVTLQRHMRV